MHRRDRATVSGVKRVLTVLAGAAAAAVLSLVAAAPAQADVVSDAVKALQNSPVYVAPGVDTKIDQDAVRSAIGSDSIKIAVLPSDSGNAYQNARTIGEDLGGKVTVGVAAGHTFNAASNALCAGAASVAAKAAADAHRTELRQTGDLTAAVVDFVNRVKTGPRANTEACGRSSAAGQTDISQTKRGGSALPWVLGLGAIGVAGGGALLLSRRRKRQKELEGRRAEVLSLYDRLGADVQNLQPGDNEVARQALADAAERYTATGSLLSHADTPGEYEAARRAALEGLQAARTARKALGIDPGPDLPQIAPAQGEQLSEKREVTVDGKTYQGYPEYTPGAPYYYGGGAGVPGGWYSFPFWETLLLGSVLSGGFGGWGGGGYGAGYDRGYDAGQEDAEDRSDSGWGGGDWGGGGGDGGGGDWGGGDWGGGGGGDWGGGGGDSGGGSW
jgi:hypothetical protein